MTTQTLKILSQPQIKMRPMSTEELTKLINQKYQQRAFIADDLKEYVSILIPEKAFALSRLLPKEILEKLLIMRGAEAFGNNIIEYYTKISVDGKLLEPIAKQAEELFLISHSAELLKLLGGSGY